MYGDSTNGNPGEPEYKVIPNYSKFRYDPTYIPTEGNTTITYKLYDNGGDNDGVIQIHAYDKNKKFLWWDFDGWRGEIGRTRTYTLPTGTRYIRLGVTTERVRAKVEFGNVATDWTPAPEDIQSDINDLQQNSPTEDQKKWLNMMGQVLLADSKESGNIVTINGLSINRSVFLRFADGKPSAMIGGDDAILTAGVSGYGTTNQSIRTAIYQDGSAKFGDVKLSDKTITLMPKSGLPLRVSAEKGTFIENFLENSKVDKISLMNKVLLFGVRVKQEHTHLMLRITIPS